MAPAGLLEHAVASTGIVGSSQMSFQGLARLGARKHLNLISLQKWDQQLGGLKISLHAAAAATAPGRKNLTLGALAATAPAPELDASTQDNLKRAVARKAVELVKSGMIVGLGTGSTASMAIEELGKLISQNKVKDVVGVATSYQSRVLARQFGVKTVDLNDVNHIDVAFDGADEVDASMNLIKGGGAAHTMEKVVDSIAKQCVILIDQTKVVPELGLTFPLPVEVLPFALSPVLRALVGLGGVPEIRNALRKDGPVITDLGNMVVDVRFPEGIKNPAELENKINMIPGVIENGRSPCPQKPDSQNAFRKCAYKVLVNENNQSYAISDDLQCEDLKGVH
jgi:ribose 5-phosphate isomerase A